MKNFIIDTGINYICKYNNYSDTKIKEIKYGLESIYLSFSKIIFISIVALMLGILIPAGLIFLWESIKGKIEKLDDLADLPVHLLAELPYKEDKIVVSTNTQNDENKSFRNLRTYLESSFEDDTKTVMLTDLHANSGKSYVAVNLAKVFALKQKRVALINFDEDDKMLHTILDKNELGVYDYLSEKDGSQQSVRL